MYVRRDVTLIFSKSDDVCPQERSVRYKFSGHTCLSRQMDPTSSTLSGSTRGSIRMMKVCRRKKRMLETRREDAIDKLIAIPAVLASLISLWQIDNLSALSNSKYSTNSNYVCRGKLLLSWPDTKISKAISDCQAGNYKKTWRSGSSRKNQDSHRTAAERQLAERNTSHEV